jgi:hypothetical protein
MSYAEHPARCVASKKGDLEYQGPKYRVVESGIVVEAAYDRGRPRHRGYLTRERLAGI